MSIAPRGVGSVYELFGKKRKGDDTQNENMKFEVGDEGGETGP